MSFKLVAYGVALLAILGGLWGLWFVGDRHGQAIVNARFTAYREAENAKIVQIQAANASKEAALQTRIAQEGASYAKTIAAVRSRFNAAFKRLRDQTAANGPGSVSSAATALCRGPAASQASQLSAKLAQDLGLVEQAEQQTQQLVACQKYVRTIQGSR